MWFWSKASEVQSRKTFVGLGLNWKNWSVITTIWEYQGQRIDTKVRGIYSKFLMKYSNTLGNIMTLITALSNDVLESRYPYGDTGGKLHVCYR